MDLESTKLGNVRFSAISLKLVIYVRQESTKEPFKDIIFA